MKTLNEYIKTELKQVYFVYYYYPYLVYMEELERDSKFEECQIILDALTELKSEYNLTLHTKLSEEAEEDYKAILIDMYEGKLPKGIKEKKVEQLKETVKEIVEEYSVIQMYLSKEEE